MTRFLIIAHVLVAVLFFDPVTVATTTFQGPANKAHAGDTQAAGAATTLAQDLLAALVRLLGVATVLAVIAWATLLPLIIPCQKKMMGVLGPLDAAGFAPERDRVEDFDKTTSQLSMLRGTFTLLWLIMLVLMYL